jgi:hypothetical protein
MYQLSGMGSRGLAQFTAGTIETWPDLENSEHTTQPRSIHSGPPSSYILSTKRRIDYTIDRQSSNELRFEHAQNQVWFPLSELIQVCA